MPRLPAGGACQRVALPRATRSERHFAVRFDALASVSDRRHDGLLINVRLELDNHFLKHEIDNDSFHASHLSSSGLHFVGAIGAVDFDGVGFFS